MSFSNKRRLSKRIKIAEAVQPCFLYDMLGRILSDEERGFLVKIAGKLHRDTGQSLLNDISMSRVIEQGGYLLVEMEDYKRPEYRGHSNLPVEGKLQDILGEPVSILVNMDQNGRLLALETIWWGSESGTSLDWSTISIVPTPR